MADITGYRWRVWADTAATLTTQNPTLLSGEIVKESDTGKMKIGDGSTAWSNLPYYVPAGNASYNFTIDTTSSAVAMTASVSWVYSDGFTGTTYPSVLNTTLSDGDIVTFKNTGATGNNVTGLPDDRPLLDGEIISYIFVDGSYSNISEQPPIVRAEYNNGLAAATGGDIIYDKKVEDTHSSYNTSTGEYTCSVPGVYSMNFGFYCLNAGTFEIDVNDGSGYTGHSYETFASSDRCNMSDSVRLVIGDKIKPRSSGAGTAQASALSRMTIERIGN